MTPTSLARTAGLMAFRLGVVLAALAVLAIVYSFFDGNDDEPTAPAPTSTATAASEPPSEAPVVSDAERACNQKKDNTGDIYAVYITPGLMRTAQTLGGVWQWDHAADECVTSTEFVLRTTYPGDCIQVGLAKDNPDFDPDVEPAGELDVITEQRGDC